MVLLVVIFALTAAAAALLLNVKGEVDPIEARLQELERRRQAHNAVAVRLEVAPDEAKEKGFKALMGQVDKNLEGQGWGRRLQERLRRAGLKLLPTEFLFFQMVSAGGMVAMSALLMGGTLWWVLGCLGFFLPFVWLGRREKARLKMLEGQLPDALSLIANSLRSGYSFLQAMEVVSREMPEPISKELAQVLRENKVGIPLEEALLGLSRRVGSADLDLVVTAVLIQRQIGGNLAEVVEKIGSTIKDRIQLMGQVKALTAQGRMSGLIVSLMPVVLALILNLINPDYIRPMFTHPLGWLLIGMGVVSQSIGIMVIRKLVQLEV